MAIADVVTMGFGSYSSVNKVPTLGYSIGAITDVSAKGLDYIVEGPRAVYSVDRHRAEDVE